MPGSAVSFNAAPPRKRLLFDRRYGLVFDEWREPSEEALSGGRGMFCILPIARAAIEKASEMIDFLACSTLEVLERPEILSSKAFEVALNGHISKIASSVKETKKNLFESRRDSKVFLANAVAHLRFYIQKKFAESLFLVGIGLLLLPFRYLLFLKPQTALIHYHVHVPAGGFRLFVQLNHVARGCPRNLRKVTSRSLPSLGYIYSPLCNSSFMHKTKETSFLDMSGVWFFKNDGVMQLVENPGQGCQRRKVLVHVLTGQVVTSYKCLEKLLRELGWDRYYGGDFEFFQFHKPPSIDLISLPKHFARFSSVHMYDIVVKNPNVFLVRDS